MGFPFNIDPRLVEPKQYFHNSLILN